MKCKHCIVELLKRIGDAYKVDKRQKIFILDLMMLDVPNLLFVPKDDDRENELQDVIMHQILSIVVTLCVFV